MGKALAKNLPDVAKIHASNAIRHHNTHLQLLKLASRVDAAAARIQTALTMRQVSQSMVGVVKGMDKALQSMNLEQISLIMDRFESQFEELDLQGEAVGGAMEGTSILQLAPQHQVDELLQQAAEEQGLVLGQRLGESVVPTGISAVQEPDQLQERLAKLRNLAS